MWWYTATGFQVEVIIGNAKCEFQAETDMAWEDFIVMYLHRLTVLMTRLSLYIGFQVIAGKLLTQIICHYGIHFFLSGNPDKMTGSKLQTQCVSIPNKTVLVTCFHHEQLIGHALTIVWNFEHGKSTC